MTRGDGSSTYAGECRCDFLVESKWFASKHAADSAEMDRGEEVQEIYIEQHSATDVPARIGNYAAIFCKSVYVLFWIIERNQIWQKSTLQEFDPPIRDLNGSACS
jgi:hypothetical protein